MDQNLGKTWADPRPDAACVRAAAAACAVGAVEAAGHIGALTLGHTDATDATDGSGEPAAAALAARGVLPVLERLAALPVGEGATDDAAVAANERAECAAAFDHAISAARAAAEWANVIDLVDSMDARELPPAPVSLWAAITGCERRSDWPQGLRLLHGSWRGVYGGEARSFSRLDPRPAAAVMRLLEVVGWREERASVTIACEGGIMASCHKSPSFSEELSGAS